MKTSFSTLGCPDWTWDDIVIFAKDFGFTGIELRGIEKELFVPRSRYFAPSALAATKARLEGLKLEIPCLTSSCYLFNKDKIDMYIQEGKDYIDLAESLKVPFIRVLGDTNPEPGTGIDDDFTAANIALLADYALEKNVTILVETNGVFAQSSRLKSLIEKVGRPNVGVLWDIHHPYRYFKEPVESTVADLGQLIRFVHVKDSIVENGKIKYKMLGAGDLPVQKALEQLKKIGYEGYVSLEWVKRWDLSLEEPGVVFSHYADYMRKLKL